MTFSAPLGACSRGDAWLLPQSLRRRCRLTRCARPARNRPSPCDRRLKPLFTSAADASIQALRSVRWHLDSGLSQGDILTIITQ